MIWRHIGWPPRSLNFVDYNELADIWRVFQFVIKAAAAGEVQAVLYKKGDTVAKGVSLVTIKSANAEQALEEEDL